MADGNGRINGVGATAEAQGLMNAKLEDLLEKTESVVEHTRELPGIAQEIRLLRTELVDTLSNRIPVGTMPLDTHREILTQITEREKEYSRTLLRLVFALFFVILSVLGLKTPLENWFAPPPASVLPSH